MARQNPFVKMLVTIIDRETKDVIAPEVYYERHVKVPAFAYHHPVVLQEHIQSEARLLYVTRVINKYQVEDPELAAKLEGRNWTLAINFLAIEYPEGK
jgi:hypothetical protein